MKQRIEVFAQAMGLISFDSSGSFPAAPDEGNSSPVDFLVLCGCRG